MTRVRFPSPAPVWQVLDVPQGVFGAAGVCQVVATGLCSLHRMQARVDAHVAQW
ncbi:MAG: hypothetical protein RI949_2492 [Pseudomonadota bacterium]